MKKIAQDDANYPFLLSKIFDPPSFLYYEGELPKEDEVLVAVVGSRACTPYGRQVAEEISYNLAKEGITIVSGLALGIDSVAHRAALTAKGKTIAVLGSGLDVIYPSSHMKLAKEIIENGGALISEFSPGTPPLPHHFPLRNRIISGISQGIIVVEAGFKSGALITARCALEQGREVFAVPGSIYSLNSQGSNSLIKMGAHVVTNFLDVLDVLNLKPKTKTKTKRKEIKCETKEEAILLALLGPEPVSIDKLHALSKLDIAVVTSTLVMLEIKGLVKNIGGARYIKIKE
uniref:DNA-protecting protein DprA n=1 Tax=candidate division CPR3 bacterium TaxID=2268181 RepID=A0A7V3J8W6_UNCC3